MGEGDGAPTSVWSAGGYQVSKGRRQNIKKTVVFSNIVTLFGKGSKLNHTFRSCQNSEIMIKWVLIKPLCHFFLTYICYYFNDKMGLKEDV